PRGARRGVRPRPSLVPVRRAGGHPPWRSTAHRGRRRDGPPRWGADRGPRRRPSRRRLHPPGAGPGVRRANPRLAGRHALSGIPADIVLAGPGIEELFLARAKVVDVDGAHVPVACAEDVIVMKLLAGRPKDVDDVVAILAAHPDDLDLDLVRGTV